MANKERFLSGKRKLAALSGLSTDRHVYLSPEETEPNLGFVGEKTLPIRDEYYQLVTVENGGQYDRYWQVAPSGILTTGLTIFDEGGIVGTGNSISKLDFVGNIVNVTANNFGSISTITISPPGSASQIIFNHDGSFAGTPYLLVNNSGIVTATDVFQIGVGGTILSSKTNGNIGIGSAIPKYDLDIVGNVKISGTIVDAADGTGSTGELLVKTATGGMQWQTANAVTSGAGGTISQIQYHSASGTVGGADVFWYDYTNDRIGIGTQFPEVIFEVVGNSKFSETTETKNLVVTGVSSFVGVSTFSDQIIIGAAVSTSDLTVDGGSFVSGMSTATIFDGKVSKKAITEQVLTTSANGQNDLLLIYDAGNDNVRKISIEDATFQGLQGIQGSQGLQGTQGTQAAQGTTGQQGIRGAQGIQGLQGIGAAGVQGVQGQQGIQGIQGVQGTQGRQGNQGRQGRQGTTGNQGTTGSQGTQGRQGRQGTQGPGGPSTTINAASNSSDTSLHPVLVTSLGSNQTARSNTTFNFNASTGAISATKFIGNGQELTNVTAATSYYYFGINKNKNDVSNYGKLSFTEVDSSTSVDYSEKNDFIRDSQPILQDFVAPGGITASIDSSGHLVLNL